MKPETKLYRQVHKSWLNDDGQPTSQAFKPTKKDEWLLSVYDGDKIKAKDSWEHYTRVLGLSSVGVIAVTVGECQGLGLDVRPDPAPFPEHSVIDFSGLSSNAIYQKAKALRKFALKRKWKYKP